MGAPHLLHIFSTFVPAGPEMRTVRLINALGDEFRHSILAIDARTEAREQFAAEAPVEILESLPRAGTPRTVHALRGLMDRLQPDLVLSYNWGAFDSVLASRTLGRQKRHLHHEDGFNIDEAQQFKGRRIWARRLLLPGLARVIVPSHVLAGVAAQHWNLSGSKLQLIPNGIDLGSFGSGDGAALLRNQLGIPQEALVIGFVGHLRPVKNPARLVRVLAQLTTATPAHLVLLGEGEEKSAVEQAAQELGLRDRVHLVGHQSDPAPWYGCMDLFAISSDSEQMPVALLEAMASCLPVVSTDVGDVKRMLPEAQSGFVHGGEDALQVSLLASSINALAGDPEARQRLGAANRARAEEQYSFERMLTAYRSLYLETLRA